LWASRAYFTLRSCCTNFTLRASRANFTLCACCTNLSLCASRTNLTLCSCCTNFTLRASRANLSLRACCTNFSLCACCAHLSLWASWANFTLCSCCTNFSLRASWAYFTLRSCCTNFTLRACRACRARCAGLSAAFCIECVRHAHELLAAEEHVGTAPVDIRLHLCGVWAVGPINGREAALNRRTETDCQVHQSILVGGGGVRLLIHQLRRPDDAHTDTDQLIDNAAAVRAAHHRLIVDALRHLGQGGHGGEEQAEGEEYSFHGV